MTRMEFITAFNQLEPGKGFAYHVGNLCRDRQMGKDGANISTVANEAMLCQARGLAFLVQRRVEPGIDATDNTMQERCEYIIRKRVSVAAAPRTVNEIRAAIKAASFEREAA